MLRRFKAWASDFAGRPQGEKFPVYFTVVVVALSVAGLTLDIWLRDQNFWFQRSGALLTLAGIQLQYAKIASLWRLQLKNELGQETVAHKLASGKGVGLKETAENEERTRRLAQRLYGIVTGRDSRDVWAVALIIVGTIVWGFCDLPFKGERHAQAEPALRLFGVTINGLLAFLKNYPYVLATALALFGWWWVHKLNSTRDRINAERSMRNTELAKVYAVLLRAGIYGTLTKTDEDGKVTWINEELEDAVGKIYLYGTKEQVDLTQEYVNSWASSNGADGTRLLNDIREHIRTSLGLPPVQGTPSYLRVEIKREGSGNA